MTVKNVYAHQAVENDPVLRHAWIMQRMAEIRELRGLTQADLADIIGVNQAYISKIEGGTANPTLEKIMAIASALKVEPPELFAMPEVKGRVLAAPPPSPQER